jgi:hypothetical protein
MTPPRAAGMRTSQSSTNIDLGSIGSPPLKPLTPRFSLACLSSLGISIPLLFLMAPVMSLTATIFPPLSLISWAAQDPTFPKPWRQYMMMTNFYIYTGIIRQHKKDEGLQYGMKGAPVWQTVVHGCSSHAHWEEPLLQRAPLVLLLHLCLEIHQGPNL